MELEAFNDIVEDRIAGAIDIDSEDACRAVLAALATRLTQDEAVELSGELPEPLGDLLADASGEQPFDRDEFIEDVASRLDLDDVDAERVAMAVLSAVRLALEPAPTVEQVLETLPTDLAQLMHKSG